MDINRKYVKIASGETTNMKLKEKIKKIIFDNSSDYDEINNASLELDADQILKLVKEELISKLPKEKNKANESWAMASYDDAQELGKEKGFNWALKEVKEIIEKI